MLMYTYGQDWRMGEKQAIIFRQGNAWEHTRRMHTGRFVMCETIWSLLPGDSKYETRSNSVWAIGVFDEPKLRK